MTTSSDENLAKGAAIAIENSATDEERLAIEQRMIRATDNSARDGDVDQDEVPK